MSAPDRPKRPSARPPRRTTLPPPPDAAVEVLPAAAKQSEQAPQKAPAAPAPTGKKRPAARPSTPPPRPSEPAAPAAPAAAAAKANRPRVSARRASQTPPELEAAQSTETQTKATRPTAPKPVAAEPAAAKSKPKKQDAVASTAPAAVSVQASEPDNHEGAVSDEDEDIWRDSAPLPEFTEPSRAAILDTSELAREQHSASNPASRLARGASAEQPAVDAAAIGSAQSLLSTDYYFRQYGAHGIRSLSADVDEFGLDPYVEERARPALELLTKRYFRVNIQGAQHIPESGRALLVANRAGPLPWDGLMLRTALRLSRPELAPLRWLSEDSVFHYPFLGVFMNRLGAVRACPENAERLLSQDKLVAVFPEGAQGSRKLFKERYQLQRFGRGGYVKLALKLSAPIIPTAIIGAEETNPVLARSRVLGRMVGREYFPFTPTFPWLGPIGLLPAPVKWNIVVGEPVDLSSYGPDAAEDALLVHRLNEQIRGILQDLLRQGRAARRSVLFG